MSRFERIILIGAPRSGTNMLRDALTVLPGFVTWPCDEINPIWKHCHLHYPLDDLQPTSVTRRARTFVNMAFRDIASDSDARVVVEKTCANSVRVGYVRALLPDAHFLFIHRHGADAVASAIQRWTSSVELSYTLRKVRFVPWSDIPHYGWRFIRNRISQKLDGQRRMRAWGPMTARVRDAAAQGDIVSAAAWQWRECVERALNELPSSAVKVSYEAFVAKPAAELALALDKLGYHDFEGSEIVDAVTAVRADLAGRGVAKLKALGVLDKVAKIIDPALDQLGYARIT